MKYIFIILFGLLMLSGVYCTKQEVTPIYSDSIVKPDSIEQRVGTSTLFLNTLVYTKSAYDAHDAHSYAEGHILEFTKATWVQDSSINRIRIQNAITYMKHAITTPGTNTFGHDTTGQYLNLFTYIIVNSAYMDTYPDSALIFSPTQYPKFKTWFINTVTKSMQASGCKNITSNYNTTQYLIKIHSGAN